MPRKQPIEAPAPKKAKRGQLFDKLGEPQTQRPMRKVLGKVLPPKQTGHPSKAKGNWTPRKTGKASQAGKPQPCVYSDNLITEALMKTGGLMTYAARMIGMDVSAMSLRLKNNPRLAEARMIAKEHFKDKAESVLDHHLNKKSLTAAIHVTKLLCRDRGYVEKQDVEQVNGPIDLDTMSDDQLTALVEAIGKKLEGK